MSGVSIGANIGELVSSALGSEVKLPPGPQALVPVCVWFDEDEERGVKTHRGSDRMTLNLVGEKHPHHGVVLVGPAKADDLEQFKHRVRGHRFVVQNPWVKRVQAGLLIERMPSIRTMAKFRAECFGKGCTTVHGNKVQPHTVDYLQCDARDHESKPDGTRAKYHDKDNKVLCPQCEQPMRVEKLHAEILPDGRDYTDAMLSGPDDPRLAQLFEVAQNRPKVADMGVLPRIFGVFPGGKAPTDWMPAEGDIRAALIEEALESYTEKGVKMPHTIRPIAHAWSNQARGEDGKPTGATALTQVLIEVNYAPRAGWVPVDQVYGWEASGYFEQWIYVPRGPVA